MLRSIISMAPQKQATLPHDQYLLSCASNHARSFFRIFLILRAANLAALPYLEA